MKEWTLHVVIEHFDYFVKDVDFANLPAKESEEYRQLVLQTANDVVFREGRYSSITEWTLEMFDVPEVCALVSSLGEISRLTDDERIRLGFYLDLKEVCYPLFRGKQVDWSAWPWNLNDGASSFENKELFALITQRDGLIGQPLPFVSAAILYDLEKQIWTNEEGLYSSVACNEASLAYQHSVGSAWKSHLQTEEEQKALIAAVCKCADDLWTIENHALVGQLLGFDQLTQSVYDSFDTYIDSTYRHNQVLCAKALVAWLREHWTMNEPHPDKELVEALYAKWQEVMTAYDVTSPDADYSWNILTFDVLGMSMFSEEEEEDPWED